MLAPSDTEYIDQLISTIGDACTLGQEGQLMGDLARLSERQEAEIERLCNNNHQDFVRSVDHLLGVRKGTVDLTEEILKLNETIQSSTERLVEAKKALVNSREVRENIDEATRSLKSCLEVLGLANRVGDLLREKKRYAALRALEELQNVHLREVTQFEIAKIIQKSVPSMKAMVKDAVMTDLNTWLYKVRENSMLLGQVAFYHTNQRRHRQKERVRDIFNLRWLKINSALELALEEREEFDVLDNEDITVDFTPLFECLHIHEAMGERGEFRVTYADVRRQQKDLLFSSPHSVANKDLSCVSRLLEDICGFAIIEKSTLKKTSGFRSPADVDDLWDSMCKKAIIMISQQVENVTEAEILLKIKTVLALFIQTMATWEYSVKPLDEFLLGLFDKYSECLKKNFIGGFQKVAMSDDYTPMAVENRPKYDNIMKSVWYSPDKDPEIIQFPTVMPFSGMYPLCCRYIRDLLEKYYFYADEYFQNQGAIDRELRRSLDELLCEQVCGTLVEHLNSQYLGQIVQILINLEHFEFACQELEYLLAEGCSASETGVVTLKATERFRSEKKTAEKRIFELVNSKIDDLIGTAEYDWMAAKKQSQPSEYLQQTTLFLRNNMSSTLLNLPREIQGFIYFDALSHIASSILGLPLSEGVDQINKISVHNLDMDVKYLQEFVDSLNEPMLPSVFDELRQTIDLLKSDSSDEFYNISTKMKKYANVDPINGPVLLGKYALFSPPPSITLYLIPTACYLRLLAGEAASAKKGFAGRFRS
ncbi:exocyst complex subunit Sec15-like protein [Tuber magnatum]|uniref:Exocyst complex component SEC15 n=1 Tax=Tuber magnatum TaxID=42249 RepID=A0A317SE15_9PEZI|nr:exocyst complex subunit Sec15-like protein [Tuber magnatum]